MLQENINNIIDSNTNKLKSSSYPGRGIIIGLTPDGKYMVQVYWIMGRSENSKNRVFVEENGSVRTEAYDPGKLTDPSLIIYTPIRNHNNLHIVSNGDQTDTIFDFLSNGKTFEEALHTREFEPDPPILTPRISGVLNVGHEGFPYKLSILKSYYNNSDRCIRNFYHYESAIPGVGHCITTYSDNGDPIPSFEGEPYILRTFNEINETLDYYWNIIDSQTKVAMLVKYINVDSKESKIIFININDLSVAGL